MKIRHYPVFKILLILFCLLFCLQYLLVANGVINKGVPVMYDIVLFISFFVAYLFFYRKQNLLCFELMAMPVAFLGLFFDDIIYPFSPELSTLYSVGDSIVKLKSESLQMEAFFIFLLGGAMGNEHSRKVNQDNNRSLRGGDLYLFSLLISFIILLVIIYYYLSGIFSSWFYYSNADWMDVDDRNNGIGTLTCLLLVAICVELIRLRDLGVSSLKHSIKRCNKFFLVEWIGISVLLLYSGNRNEMLIIVLPLIVGYSKCINTIKNKILIVSAVIGVFMMALVGLTREQGVSMSGGQLSVLSFTRDFADLGYNTDYLISYTDKYGTTNFRDVIPIMLSGIPVIGSLLLRTFSFAEVQASASITTESVVSGSGLGTSLVGDLYYTAGFIWVAVYLFFFGYVMSRLYHTNKFISIFQLAFYSYMVANAVYYVRSSWIFPYPYIEYVIIILLIGNIFSGLRKIKA